VYAGAVYTGESVRIGPLIVLFFALSAGPVAASETKPTAFLCCDSPSMQRVLDKYLNLQEALAGKGAHQTSSYAHAMLNALRGASTGSGGERDLVADMTGLLDRVKNGDAKAVRSIFDDLSRSMIALALRHEGGSIEVAEASCAAGPWLQRDTRSVQSPWGRRCGTWQ
jgi:hypothetical protein